MWAKPDLPVEVRAPESYLFGLKKVLVGWGFAKACVRVDTAERNLKVGGELVVSTSVVGGRLRHAWHGSWATWAELHQSDEVVQLGRRVAEALGRAGGGGKGKGLMKGNVQ